MHFHNHNHAHNHGHSHANPDDSGSDSGRNILIAFLLNAVFTIIELIGGYLTNSVAILADALHDLGDTLGLGFAMAMHRLGRRKRDRHFSYGYRRFTLLSAVINSSVLIGGAAFIVYICVQRLSDPPDVHAGGMIGLAVVGVLFNGAGAFFMRRGSSLNERVVSWHLIEDLLGWLAVLITALVMYFFNVPILDPILSLLINLFVAYNAIKILVSTLKILFQGIPSGVTSVHSIEKEICESRDVLSIHDTHLWSLDGEYHILTAHVVVADTASIDDMIRVKSNVRRIAGRNAINHATIEIEKESEDCGLANC